MSDYTPPPWLNGVVSKANAGTTVGLGTYTAPSWLSGVVGGGGGASNANPTAGKPSNGGGGFLGFLGRVISGAKNAVAGVPAGVGELGKELGTGIARTGEQFGNELLNAGSIGHAGRANQFHFGGSPDALGNFNSLQGSTARSAAENTKTYPALSTVGPGLETTGNHIAGLGQLAAGGVVGHPLAGSGFENQLGSDYSKNPVGSALNDLLNIAMVAGPAGSLIGDGAAEGSKAALVGEKLSQLGHVAGKGAALPVLPFTKGLGLAADLAGKTALGQAAAEHVANPDTRVGALVDKVRQAGENARAAHEIQGTKMEAGAPFADQIRENARVLSGIKASPDEFAAGLLRTQGHTPLLEALSSHPEAEPVVHNLLSSLTANDKTAPTMDAARLAVVPNSNVIAAENALRDINATREQGNLAGVGFRPGQNPLSTAQLAPEPLLDEVDKQTADARLAAHNADQGLATANAGAGVPTGPRPAGAVSADMANIPALQLASHMLSNVDSMGPKNYAAISDLAAEHGLQSPEQIPNYLAHLRQEGGETTTPAARGLLRNAQDEANKAHANLAQVEAQARDSLDAAPAAHRTPLTAVRNTIGALADEASKASDPAVQASLSQIAKDIEPLSHLDFWANKDEQPTHIVQTSKGDINREARGKTPQSGSNTSYSTTKAGHVREGISTRYDPKGQEELMRADLRTKANNEAIKQLDAEHSTTPAAEGVTGLKGTALYEAMSREGFRPWNPEASYKQALTPDLTTLTEDSKFLPRSLHTELARTFNNDEPKGLADLAMKETGKGIDKATRGLYRSTLQLSPHYVAMRTMGNAMMAMVKGDIAPADLARRGLDAVKLIKSGEAPALFDQHLNDEVSPVGKFGRVTQALPRFIDKAARTAVFLDQLDKNGGDYAKAVRMGNEAMGDYSTMSGRERGVAGRLFPSYGWMKSVTQAAAKLGAEHPASVLWALHMGNLAAQNPQAFKQGPIAEELNPLSIFRAGPALANPIIRGLAGAATGFNISKLKDVTRPPDQKQTGPLPAKDLLYYLTNQLPAGKLEHQSPVSGLTQDSARYDTGQLHLGPKGKILPSYMPVSHTPLGDFGSYWRQFLGNPAVPKANDAGKQALLKSQKTKAKTATTYEREVSAQNANGVR